MQALLLIDIQNDFLPGGALAVPDGDAVVPVANALMSKFPLVVATQDWHTPHHQSFAVAHPGRQPGDVIDLHGLPQVLWPVHCVQGTHGASLARGLHVIGVERVVMKGADPAVDSYSGFFDNGRRHETELAALLREHGVTGLVAMGLATDYCVKATVLDALSLGYEVTVVADGCRAVDLHPGDGDRALAELAAAGAQIVESAVLIA